MKHSRVYLRRQSVRDREKFIEAVRRSQKLHRPWISLPTDAKTYRKFLQRIKQPDHAGFFICRSGDRAIVGAFNVNNIVRGKFLSAYLGYCAFSPFDGEGYMTEGLRLLLGHAFGKMKLHRLEANIQPDNLPSIALARRCGFRLEGLSKRYLKIAGKWRDHQRWAITAEDWRKAS